MTQRIYLDHAATTPVDPEVMEAMRPYFTEKFGNASSPHAFSREARAAIDEARQQVAQLIGAQPDEIVFTSGGTESDNFALIGTAFRWRDKGKRIVISAIEHHAITHTAKFLQREMGFEVVAVPVDKHGVVSPEDVAKQLTDDTVLVSVMMANNEIGTIEPIADIARVVRARGIVFHTDAVQAVGQVPVNVNALGVDLLTLTAHKFYGPKGIGALFIRRGTRMFSLLHGGEQERGRRAGTENVPGIVGLGKACAIAQRDMAASSARLTALRDRLIRGIMERIPDVRLNGHPTERLPNNVHICVKGVAGEVMQMNLDLAGIAVSIGSACTSGALEPSHVLQAIGVPREWVRGPLRLTLGRDNTEEDVDRTVEELARIVTRLQQVRRS
ncbi:MAG: cysteine desulfurase NifS [Abditibacteriales bacterium]|nr:cysteine desulfurase NifS [Abditibacteriales bacterium]